MRACLLVGLGGFVGSVLRYGLSLLPVTGRSGFPVMTLVINVVGALLIGLLVGLATRFEGFSSDWLTFLKVGVCGGFTTFSTFALELNTLMGSGRVWTGIAYVLASLALGVSAVWLGRSIVA